MDDEVALGVGGQSIASWPTLRCVRRRTGQGWLGQRRVPARCRSGQLVFQRAGASTYCPPTEIDTGLCSMSEVEPRAVVADDLLRRSAVGRRATVVDDRVLERSPTVVLHLLGANFSFVWQPKCVLQLLDKLVQRAISMRSRSARGTKWSALPGDWRLYISAIAALRELACRCSNKP